MEDKIEVFLSYSHADSALKDMFVKQLNVLVREDNITLWTDDKIYGGRDWDKEINEKLVNADLIILLISENFIASNYCYNIELKEALRLERARKAVVIPVGLRSIAFERLEFSYLQMLPKHPTRPPFVESWPNLAEAFTEVIRGIQLSLKTVVIEMKKWAPLERKEEIRTLVSNNKLDEAFNRLTDFVNDFSQNELTKDEATVLAGDYIDLVNDKGKVDYVQFRRALRDSVSQIFVIIDRVLKEIDELLKAA